MIPFSQFSLAACAMAAAALLAGCSQGTPAKTPEVTAVPATVIEAAQKRVPIEVGTIGQVQGSKEVEVRARVSGILLKRLYREGDLINEGAPLFQIDPEPYEIALAQTRAQLAQERARNEQATRESGRLEKLAAEKAISQKEYDDASSVLKLSNAALQAAQANVRQAELNLSYTLVKAPVSGVTGRMARSEGSLVTAGQDSSLLTTINQVDPIWVQFSLAESDLAKLPGKGLTAGAGADVRLTLPEGSPYPAKGRLNFAATQIDPRLATQQLRAEFPNPKAQLVPGEFVTVQLTVGERSNVFLVPQTAVMQTEKGPTLFVLDKENKAAIRPVQTGDWIGTDWMVLSGLGNGDRVVVDNLLKLRPGIAVKPLAPGQGTEGQKESGKPAGGAARK